MMILHRIIVCSLLFTVNLSFLFPTSLDHRTPEGHQCPDVITSDVSSAK